jgi:hypothetical protein
MTQETRTKILVLRAQREPHKVICNETGVSHRTVLRVIAENRTQFVMHQADCTDKSFYKFGMEEEIQTEFLAMNLAKAEEALAKRNYDSIPTDKLQRIVDRLRTDARKLFEKKEKDMEKCLEREDQIDVRRKKEQAEQGRQTNEEKSKTQSVSANEQNEHDTENQENHLDRGKANPVSEAPEPTLKLADNTTEISSVPSTSSIPSSPFPEPSPTNTAQIIPLPAQDTVSVDHEGAPKSPSELQAEQEDQERAGRAYRSAARHQNAQIQHQNQRMA